MSGSIPGLSNYSASSVPQCFKGFAFSISGDVWQFWHFWQFLIVSSVVYQGKVQVFGDFAPVVGYVR